MKHWHWWLGGYAAIAAVYYFGTTGAKPGESALWPLSLAGIKVGF